MGGGSSTPLLTSGYRMDWLASTDRFVGRTGLESMGQQTGARDAANNRTKIREKQRMEEMGERDPGRTRMSPARVQSGCGNLENAGWRCDRKKSCVFRPAEGTSTPRVSAVPSNLRSSSRPGDVAVSGTGHC